MAIRSVRIENFRSFDDFELNLGQFNVLVGANASGKSNLLHVFRFLKDIADHGLKDAISLQGGVDFLTNARIGRSRPLSVTITADADDELTLHKDDDVPIEARPPEIKVEEVGYHFSLKFSENEEVKIVSDRLTLECAFSKLVWHKSGSYLEKKSLGKGNIVLHNTDGQFHCDLKLPEGMPFTENDFLPPIWKLRQETAPASLLLERRFLQHPLFLPPAEIFMGIDTAIYDFNSRQPKRSTEIAGRSQLALDGSNLALVLRKILDDDKEHRRFRLLVQAILPFVEDVAVQPFADQSLLLMLKESYAPQTLFPATFISDGTINVIALIVALYFEEHSVVMIEEPERNIHAHLISDVVEMLKDKAEKKQILVTTHSPEVVQHAGLENLLLISRYKDGVSRVSRPSEKEMVRSFLEHEIGIGDLHKHNLLEH